MPLRYVPLPCGFCQLGGSACIPLPGMMLSSGNGTRFGSGGETVSFSPITVKMLFPGPGWGAECRPGSDGR
jgi:hypothetical protein